MFDRRSGAQRKYAPPTNNFDGEKNLLRPLSVLIIPEYQPEGNVNSAHGRQDRQQSQR